MLIGYAQVLTQDRDAAAQIAVLKTAECDLVFQKKAAGETGRSCVACSGSCARATFWWSGSSTATHAMIWMRHASKSGRFIIGWLKRAGHGTQRA